MAEATLTLNGRTYRLICGEGEEARLRELSQVVSAKLQALVAEYGQVGEDRLLLLSALQIADEMLDARAKAQALERALLAMQQQPRSSAA